MFIKKGIRLCSLVDKILGLFLAYICILRCIIASKTFLYVVEGNLGKLQA
jgi:hypothetical protein